jgi:hypothetical protein
MDEILLMIRDCERRESKLSDWERGFIDSLSDRIGLGRGVTKLQEDKLEDIWTRVTKEG